MWGHVLACFSVYIVSLLFWLPALSDVATPEADQVFHGFWFAAACRASELSLGSLDGSTGGQPDGLFALGLFASIQQQLSCRIAGWLHLDVIAVYLCVALAILFLVNELSTRQAGFSPRARLLLGFLLATAPCSFSRLGHLDQTVLIAVTPSLMACLQLHRLTVSPSAGLRVWSVLQAGLVAGVLTVPAQEYYVAFSLLLVITQGLISWLACSARPGSARQLGQPAWTAAWFIAGYVLVLAAAFVPKLLAAVSPGPPPLWMTPRRPTEQLLYGLMPMTWFVPSTLQEPVKLVLQGAGFPVHLESYFWSAGSLLIPIAMVFALRRLLAPAECSAPAPAVRRQFFAGLLLLVVFLALSVMTMGGLGTLFATFLSPVLRSLNRFTVFVYGAAVVFLVAEWDAWWPLREPRHAKDA